MLLWLALQLSVVLAPKSAGGLELQASSRPEQELVLALPLGLLSSQLLSTSNGQ